MSTPAKQAKPRYRLALDLGSNSIGWVLFALDDQDWPTQVVWSGVRIFSNSREAKTSVPLTVSRRIARGARRRRDRFLQRKRSLLRYFRKMDLLPSEPAEQLAFAKLDPYHLRHEALSRQLSKRELGRALLHLAQRRGFLSNRKNQTEEEGGESLSGRISSLKAAINNAGATTLGSFLWLERRFKGLSTRMRSDLDWYPNRKLYEEEFDAIRKSQAELNSELQLDWDRLKRIIFFQRPLKKQSPGNCLFDPSMERGLRALPSYQRFRTLQQLANLKFAAPGQAMMAINESQRAVLITELFRKEKLTFEQLRKRLGLSEDTIFNLELGRNSFSAAKHLFGDKTSALLSRKGYFGAAWYDMPEAEMNQIVERLINEEDDELLEEWLKGNFKLAEEQVAALVKLSEESFERGYAEFCAPVLDRLSATLANNFGFTYDQAAASLGFHHSDSRPQELLAYLPYYGEVLKNSVRKVPDSKVADERESGKIFNPTVHVALNQLRKIVNGLVNRYGPMDQIIIEVARDLPLSERGIRELNSEIKRNEKQNEEWATELRQHGLPNTYANRQRLRLWYELSAHPAGRHCPYSGEVINIAKLFSPDVEVDHILPRSRTFTNHHSNLVVCVKRANQYKGDRSPFEAFSAANSPYDYQEVLQRVSNLPKHKQSKFAPDAMAAFADQGGFLERQLNDTRFISKATGQYLQHICRKIMVSRGRLTAFLRGSMDLSRLLSVDGKKNRADHRHHAVDAFTVGLCAPKTLLAIDKMLSASGRAAESSPLSNLIATFKDSLEKMIVSHRVDHNPATRFFEETAYGKTKNGESGLWIVRKPVATITDKEAIVDERIRTFTLSLDGVSKDELANLVYQRFGARKLRIYKKDSSAVKIMHPRHNPRFEKWLIPGDICRVEFWRAPADSKLIPVSYTSQEVAVIEEGKRQPLGNRLTAQKRPHPAARKILSIHKGDYLRLVGDDGRLRTVVVESLKPANNIIMFSAHQIGKNENAKGRTVTFNGLANKAVRVVHVDELGNIKDPGPWWINDSKDTRAAKSG